MGLSRQEYWSGLSFPSPEDLSDPGIEPGSPSLQADSLPSELQGRSVKQSTHSYKGKWLLWNVLSKYIFKLWYSINHRLLWWLSGKETTCQNRRCGFNPSVGKIPWRRRWLLTPVFWPGELYGQRSLAVYSPWGRKRVGHDLLTTTTAINQSQYRQEKKKRNYTSYVNRSNLIQGTH